MFRAFSSSSSREIILEKPYFQTDINSENKHGLFSVAIESIQNSFCSSQLGALPLWSGTNKMTFGTNDGKSDIDLYQLGFGNVTSSSGKTVFGEIELNPQVEEFGADMMLYVCGNQYTSTPFFKLHVPVGAMMLSSNMIERNFVPFAGSVEFHQETAGPMSSNIEYFWVNYPTHYRSFQSVKDFFNGGSFRNDVLVGDSTHMFRLYKGRINACRQTVIRLADLSFSVGYNFVYEKGLAAVGVKITCPTGIVPDGEYFLEPTFGRGGYWGLGGELYGHYLVWKDAHKDRYIDLWWQGEALHLIQGRTPTFRTFDLKQNGKGSRYLLVQYYPEGYVLSNSAITTPGRFADMVQSAVNITTLPINSQISCEGSFAVMLDFHNKNFNAGFGGEIWGRTHERLCIDICSALHLRMANFNDFAVVGRQISGYRIDGQGEILPTYYCEPLARINKSQDPVALVGTVPGVVKPQALPDGIADARDAKNRIPAKINDALDIEGAAMPAVYAGKIFGQIGYKLTNKKYDPYLSIIGSIEHSNDQILKLWSIGIQGSISF